ncbi:hypothetical protein BJ875DRAFT_167894 [Amylocarpus encephaloides]|uniref:JmjC domain-containing protein n=1 Tax=Amylocarpus encephaloides TaxID=45428 RepID=A0A9P8C7W8_9HELO|nr:hypothetical protein BJ875DRAFT_167894 [Amylocarpus encephaloides]
MRKTSTRLPFIPIIPILTATASRPSRAQCSLQSNALHTSNFQSVSIIEGPLHRVDINEFRRRAFTPGLPIAIKTIRDASRASQAVDEKLEREAALPAIERWFAKAGAEDAEQNGNENRRGRVMSREYLHNFRETILPYEWFHEPREDPERGLGLRNGCPPNHPKNVIRVLESLLDDSPGRKFHRLSAPLSIFLQACEIDPPIQNLYIAQAQIADLPRQLRDDLPTPRIVTDAGKGDVYDANIWMGIPPTYTPLHKDPNPNLFVQLASSKNVRIFKPSDGNAIFAEVQRKLGVRSSFSIRGEEMMEGPEREVLGEAVWGPNAPQRGYEVVVNPGDALFIPKGWWHSIKSIGGDVNASVNWWFR